MAKGDFVASTWVGILDKIVEAPPSDRMLATGVVKMIRAFLASQDHGPVAVWNFYKQVLDVLVHDAAGAPFFMTLFNLEVSYQAPLGSYQQADRSIDKAPWRHDGSVTAAPWL